MPKTATKKKPPAKKAAPKPAPPEEENDEPERVWLPSMAYDVPELPKADHIEASEQQVIEAYNKFGPKDSEKRRQIVLDILTQGYSLQTAANRAGISRRLILMWRKKDAEFDAACKEAQESGIDLMEDEALRRASQGVLEPIYQGGILVGHVTKYSDRLLEMNLKARRPHVYRERVDMNHSGGFNLIVKKEDEDLL